MQSTNDQPVSLKQILERSKLQSSILAKSDLPTMDRGLDQIGNQMETLSQHTVEDSNMDIRAHQFLTKSGVNTQVLVRPTGTIHLGTPPPQRSQVDMDIHTYLQQMQDQQIQDLLESEQAKAIEACEKAVSDDMNASWKELTTKASQNVPNDDLGDMTKLKLDLGKINSSNDL
ncbi:hypothetical protein BC940DRAFT_347273 [Gongronella butleri]|nr:hypothetical protein BC940DRAFT_347273 [Gongronella butleri]